MIEIIIQVILYVKLVTLGVFVLNLAIASVKSKWREKHAENK